MDYELIRTNRKTVAVQIMPDGRIVVRAPMRCALKNIEAFLTSKKAWIEKKVSERKGQNRLAEEDKLLFSEKELARLKKEARELLTAKTAFFAEKMGVTYENITIRDQKTRWGSCSSKGNLNFNWRLILMPEPVLDYVVVHELAHRKEMNHSKRFYQVVEAAMPDYRQHQLWLRKNGGRYIKR